MQDFYKRDLAHVHDTGYGDYARKSASGIQTILTENNIHAGLIVDLGCGSGVAALEFARMGHQILGIDISEAMIALARARVPQAKFQVGSLFTAEIPVCNAVISIGECLNYLFDADNNETTLLALFERIYQSLAPGGMFIFDIAEPGQIERNNSQHFNEGGDWIVLVEKTEDPTKRILTRRIITLRKTGDIYHRDDETHRLQLYRSTEIAHQLRRVGFRVQVMRSYGQYHLPKAHAAFVATKAAEPIR